MYIIIKWHAHSYNTSISNYLYLYTKFYIFTVNLKIADDYRLKTELTNC